MLIKKKGKYQWKRKATWCIHESLSPVILAYLQTLLKQLDVPDYCGGIGMHYCKAAILEANPEFTDEQVFEMIYEGNFDHDRAHELRIEDIKTMIYGFDNKNQPDIMKYDLDHIWDTNLHCTNDEEMKRYQADDEEWHKAREKAQRMFGELYNDLDW